MKNILRAITFTLFSGAVATLSASSVCPSTPTTTSDCNYLITIGSTGTASITDVAGSSSFNTMITFTDGTTDPGNNGSLVGVVNNYSRALTSFTLLGTGTNAGAFDFSFNGICVYTNAAYCATASTGYEGPTTTFSNLQSTVLFQTTQGTVSFNPTLASGMSTYFAIQGNASDLNANGGLTISNLAFVGSTATPEPAGFALLALGLSSVLVLRRKFVRSF